jgi:hypothetical protein
VLGMGSRWSEEGWSRLSTVAQVGWRGTVAVVQTRGHRRRLAGCRELGCRWGPRRGENEGEMWPEMVAINEAPSMEMTHGVGWLWGLFTTAGSR